MRIDMNKSDDKAIDEEVFQDLEAALADFPHLKALYTLNYVQAMLVQFCFFGAYFVAYEPYRALYPDLVDEDITGRSQRDEGIAGTGRCVDGGARSE